MFIPTDAQWATAQAWIGKTEDQGTFYDRCARLGDLDLAIEESLRSQLSALESDQPGQLATADGLRLTFTDNINAIQEAMKKFNSVGGTKGMANNVDPVSGVQRLPGSPNITRLHRRSFR